ncbi:MAG: carbohydrate kinase [Treponema sp.]|nr:carbohydrate kinase [Treponema sp.]
MIICTGEAVIDMFQKNSPDFGDVFMPLPGGCSYNTSIAAGVLGASAAFFGRISKNFFGDAQIQRLREYKVKDDLIIRSDQNPILALIKTKESKTEYAFYDEGTADRLLSVDELPELPGETTCVMFGSVSMCMEPIASTIDTFITGLKSGVWNVSEALKLKTKLIVKNLKTPPVIAFDPNIRPFMIKDREAYIKKFERWVSLCDIVKISDEDSRYIYPDKTPEEALREMIDLGASLAIVTLGCEGAAALSRRGDKTEIKIKIGGIKIPRLADTVGAGDTFMGALLARLELSGKMSHNAVANLSADHLSDALTFANKAAAIVCTRYGAQPPALNEIEDFNP